MIKQTFTSYDKIDDIPIDRIVNAAESEVPETKDCEFCEALYFELIADMKTQLSISRRGTSCNGHAIYNMREALPSSVFFNAQTVV